MKIENKYLNISKIINLLYMLAFVSFLYMAFASYDVEFKSTIVLPVCYAICLFFFVQRGKINGVGSSILIIMYAFRMCCLPVLCAFGNFYLEPPKEVYIEYYISAIALMCFENVIIFFALNRIGKYYYLKTKKEEKYIEQGHIAQYVIAILIIFYIGIVVVHPELLQRFRLVINSDGIAEQKVVQELQNYGAIYYITVMLEIIGRPLLAFMLIAYFLNKNNKRDYIIAGIMGIFNIIFITDRRILSLLIGGTCLLEILKYSKGKLNKKLMYGIIVALSVITVVFCFYGENTSMRIARKFQRYFSGPTLTAIGFAVYDKFYQGPIVFFKRVFNDSIILTGLFGSFPLNDYAREVSGSGVWTPMAIGSIQYFGMFFPIVLVLIVWFIVNCDYQANRSKDNFNILVWNYLSISISVYMIMYTVDLIIYNIVFLGGFYGILIYLNNRVKVRNYKFKLKI